MEYGAYFGTGVSGSGLATVLPHYDSSNPMTASLIIALAIVTALFIIATGVTLVREVRARIQL